MIRRGSDLFLVLACSIGLIVLVLAFPFAKPARVALGLPFLLFLPGYALVAALYPRKDQLDATERLALSLGLSIAIVPFIGLALNYSPWGIRLEPILAFESLFIVLATVAAACRRWLLPAGEVFGITISWLGWPRGPLMDTALALVLMLSLGGVGAATYFVATSQDSPERLTEFYVLGPDGQADAYPSLVKVRESPTVIVGVVNREGQVTRYQLAIRIDGQDMDVIDNLVLADGQRWEGSVALVPTHGGTRQKVEFLLRKKGEDEPYRRLFLWLDVEGSGG